MTRTFLLLTALAAATVSWLPAAASAATPQMAAAPPQTVTPPPDPSWAGPTTAWAANQATSPAAGDGRPRPTGPRLSGAAKMYRPSGEDVRFTFDAHGLGTDAKGTFRVSHYLGGQGGYFAGDIDCLIVGGPVAVATGVIRDTNIPAFRGVRKGFTVYDNGRRDRVGYSWVLDPGGTDSVPPCVSAAPFEKVETGDFRVVEWLPPYPTG